MIPAYKEKWHAFHHSNEEYIASTTLASNKQGVISYIQNYLSENDCTSDVVDFLNSVMRNDELLDKTHVVNDGSYRKCVILVRPDGVLSHQGTTDLQFYVDNAEIFFLNMTSETWKEVNAYFDAIMEHFRDPYGYGEVEMV